MEGSTALQSSRTAEKMRLTSASVSSRTSAVSKRLPLKWRMRSMPKSPPVDMAEKSWPIREQKRAGSLAALSAIREKR
ncbi:MAG: hypothetical protein BWX70_03394 [Verrucomicrobia bacterium ADurb.Bin070]|nr:MAG: hypothetical protein BWX70_03394 [Verrucomicrobia bacterium ADurb.Bin070]